MNSTNIDNTFICAYCGGIFIKAQSEEDAIAEVKNTFGVTPNEAPCSAICDKCYNQFMAWHEKTIKLN